MRVLVVTAVAAERDAVLAGCRPAEGAPAVDVVAVGVGPAAAAAGTAAALAAAAHRGAPYDLVVSAGIGGGFAPRAPLGSIVVADALVAADLGAESPDGFLSVTDLGFGRTTHLPSPELTGRMAAALERSGSFPVLVAPVLTVSTATGSAGRAAELLARHPRAGAEAMEGFGAAEAAAALGVPVAEVRAVSNAVGPRDRSAWRIPEALDALRDAFAALAPAFAHFGPSAHSDHSVPSVRAVREEEPR
ncbi:futalosine hydrolase [Streptomyces sp. URMC 123]|uniref:futalosine hydrolase n=1 Tax=Streptomyces sp. URMC 123 TaxID=3423403 RepID=UPI003F1BEC2D